MLELGLLDYFQQFLYPSIKVRVAEEDEEPLELRLGRTRDPAGGVRHVSWHVGDTPRPTEVVGRRSSALEGRAGKQKAQGRTNNSSWRPEAAVRASASLDVKNCLFHALARTYAHFFFSILYVDFQFGLNEYILIVWHSSSLGARSSGRVQYCT